MIVRLASAALRTAAGSAAGLAVLLWFTTGPAVATVVDDGTETADGLSVLETVLWFVGVPLGLFVVITLLVMAPSAARGPRYRPGLGWWAAPVWFNGPDDPDAAVRAAEPTAGGGGASARW